MGKKVGSTTRESGQNELSVRGGVVKKIQQVVTLAVACLSAGCAGSLPDQIRIPGVFPQSVRSVAIQAIPVQPGTVQNVEAADDASRLFAQSLKEALTRRQPTWLVELWVEPTEAPETDLVVKAEIVDIDGGSRAARFWVGLGAGAAHSTVRVSILDKAGNMLAKARFSEATMCPIGLCVKANKAVVQQDLEILAGKAADLIVHPDRFEPVQERE